MGHDETTGDTDESAELRRELGAQIRRARLSRGYTLRQAAPLCGLSFQMLGQIEKDGANTTLHRLAGIVRGLEARIELAVDLPTAPAPSADEIPPERRALASRFLSVLPHVPQEDLDILLHQVALWERRYAAKDGV